MSLAFAADAVISITGGTSKTFLATSDVVLNGVKMIDTSVADFRVRPFIVVRYTPPKLMADGSYTKGKASMTKTVPKILASGKTTFNLVRNEIEFHPETEVAVLTELRQSGAILYMDSDTNNLWTVGSLVF